MRATRLNPTPTRDENNDAYVQASAAQTITDGGAQARANIGAIDKPTAVGIALVQALIFGS